MPSLLDPLALGTVTARNRVVFGPHETNLGRGRAISRAPRRLLRGARAAAAPASSSPRRRRSTQSDWPYERSAAGRASAGRAGRPSPRRATPTARSCSPRSATPAGRASSAYSQRELWAPSRVPEVNSREVPKAMEDDDIAAVVAGFAAAAAPGRRAPGCDGVEINAGQHSLVRQFLSGLTNQRGDEWGTDKLRFAREVLARARRVAAGDARRRPAAVVRRARAVGRHRARGGAEDSPSRWRRWSTT